MSRPRRALDLEHAALASRDDLAFLRARLEAFEAPDEEQAATRARMLAFADEHPDALLRSCRDGHFTASGLVLEAGGRRSLMTHHRKLGRWLQLGGHCDGEANPARTALVEAIEESGIAGLTIDPDPLDLDVHAIPARPGEPAHLHLDVRFLMFAPPGARARCSPESLELGWRSGEELAGLQTDDSVRRLFRRAGLGRPPDGA